MGLPGIRAPDGHPNTTSTPCYALIVVFLAKLGSYAGPEGNNLVVDVMPNVGASQPWNPRPLAPVAGDLLFVHSEIWFVRGHAAATAKHHARHPPDFGVTRNVKQRPINPVHCLRPVRAFRHRQRNVRAKRSTEGGK